MPVYDFEQLLNNAMDRICPGSTVLTSAFHRTQAGGVMGAGRLLQIQLYHKDGKQKIMCGHTRCGVDRHVCSK